jgi:hypothetical protein
MQSAEDIGEQVEQEETCYEEGVFFSDDSASEEIETFGTPSRPVVAHRGLDMDVAGHTDGSLPRSISDASDAVVRSAWSAGGEPTVSVRSNHEPNSSELASSGLGLEPGSCSGLVLELLRAHDQVCICCHGSAAVVA